MADLALDAKFLDKPLDLHEYKYERFRFLATKFHILGSACDRGDKEYCPQDSEVVCQVCRYRTALEDLPQWPEMIFADNVFRIEVQNSEKPAFIEFNALDALRLVDSKNADVKVASSTEWSESRKQETLNNVLKPFDWTFTTDYRGTIEGLQVSKTDERVDLEKLKVHEQILYFQELSLFEDELGDNGCSMMSVKFRCMPSGFFALLRFYLRVDGVLARINDTRLHWEKPNNYILREYSSREKWVQDMTEDEKANILDPNLLWQFLPTVFEDCEKLSF